MSTEICTETKRMHATSVSVSKCSLTFGFLVIFTITSGEKYGLVKVMECALTSSLLIKEAKK